MAVFFKKDNWYIDYYVNGRRKREKIGTSKKLAVTVLKKRKVQLAENKFLDIKRMKCVRFNLFADEYLKLHSKINNRGWRSAELPNVKRLKRYFGNKYLHEITHHDVEKLKSNITKEVSPATINRHLALLKSMFNKAAAWGKFEGKNPVKGIKLFKEIPRIRFLEKEEAQKLVFSCNKILKPIVITALNTGMRKGEILDLKWSDVDFKRDLICLHKTKSGERREAPMNEVVKTAFISVKKKPESPYIFCGPSGRPYRDLRRSFYNACEKAKITHFRFHDLRHTFASHLVMMGVDLITVKELMGHKKIEMTLRYAHLSPVHKKRAVDILGQHLDTGIDTTQNFLHKQKDNKLQTSAVKLIARH